VKGEGDTHVQRCIERHVCNLQRCCQCMLCFEVGDGFVELVQVHVEKAEVSVRHTLPRPRGEEEKNPGEEEGEQGGQGDKEGEGSEEEVEWEEGEVLEGGEGADDDEYEKAPPPPSAEDHDDGDRSLADIGYLLN
jgi:hypothetical protein